MRESTRTELEILDHFRLNTPTIPQMFYNTLENAGSQPANTYKSDEAWETISYAQWANISEEIALALMNHGIQKGDYIGIMSRLTAQRGWADLAILMTGAVTATITPLASDEDLVYIVNRHGLKIFMVENSAMVNRLVYLSDKMPSLKTIVCLDERFQRNQSNQCSLKEFRAGSRQGTATRDLLKQSWQQLSGNDLARINYTSSTTCELNCSLMKHSEWVQEGSDEQRKILQDNLTGKRNNVYHSIMPLSSINERFFSFYSMVAIGAQIKYGPGPNTIKHLSEIKQKVRNFSQRQAG